MITLFIKNIVNALADYAPHREMLRRLRLGQFPLDLEGPAGFYLATIISVLQTRSKGPITVVTPTEQEAEMLAEDLDILGIQAGLFPWRHVLPYRGSSVPNTISGKRCRVMSEMLKLDRGVFVTSI